MSMRLVFTLLVLLMGLAFIVGCEGTPVLKALDAAGRPSRASRTVVLFQAVQPPAAPPAPCACSQRPSGGQNGG